MVVGDVPFTGDSTLKVMYQRIQEKPKSPKVLKPIFRTGSCGSSCVASNVTRQIATRTRTRFWRIYRVLRQEADFQAQEFRESETILNQS